jgi:EAL domain-containing protein (putative c-di-GMP-specific phosphodiesterase class I)
LTRIPRNENGNCSTRLLIIDGDAETAAMIALIAREMGFQPTQVSTFEAIVAEGCDLDQFAVVSLDLEQDGLDGIQILRLLGARHCTSAVLIVSRQDRRVLDAARRFAGAQGLQVIGALEKPLAEDGVRSLLRDFRPMAGALPPRRPAPVSLHELQRGLDQGEVEVHFQPKVSVATLEFSGVEALVRWEAAARGSVPPDTFISLAERSGVIGQLTRTVLGRAFAQTAAWQAAGIQLRTAINISPHSLNELELPDILHALAAEHGLRPSSIVVEITEGGREHEEICALDVLTRLRLKGFGLSIDDFGTGYSSMLQLKQLPFNELKLSSSLIHGAAADREARVILESSVGLGRQLGLHLVAEGIERQEDWDLVTELGIDEAQGYFVARPMCAESLPDWLDRWNRLLGH